MNVIQFRHTTDENSTDVYTLFPEKKYDDGWVVGWCPELERTMAVHPANVVDEDNDE